MASVLHIWSYANTIETAVLLVIVYDIVWHRWNALKEIERDEQAENRAIEREHALEQRQIRRERQESLRRHWQELQSNLISLNRVASQIKRQRRYIEDHNDSQDATVRQVMLTITSRMPVVLSDLADLWGRTVAQLNVFPQPRDVLALEVLEVIQEIGRSVGDPNIEVSDETLQCLADLARRASDHGTLASVEG